MTDRNDLEAAWREAWIAKSTPDESFEASLTRLWQADRALNAGGSLSSIAKNQGSHSYTQPHQANRTTVEMERTRLAALKLYEEIVRCFTLDEEDYTDQSVYDQGLARFAVNGQEAYADFSGRRSCA